MALLMMLGIVGAGGLYGEPNASEKAEKEQEFIAVLQSSASLHEKARACQELAIIGSKKAVPVLAALLDDEQLSHYARFGLEPIEDPAVDDALRDALGRLEGRVLIGVVNSIGVRRDARAVGGLQELVRNPDRGAVPEALMALGKIASKDAIDTICEVLKGDSAALRISAADAALAGAERLVAMNKRKDAEKLLDIVRQSDVPEHIRVAATYNAIIIRGSSGLALLIEQLKNGDDALVAIALRAARELTGPEITRKLADQLPKVPPKVQALLIKVLADRKDPGVSESIEALAASDNPEVRAESLRALGKIGSTSAVSVLIEAVRAGGEEASIALASLRRLKGDGVDEAIVENIRNAQPDAKVKLIDVLSDRDATGAADAVFTLTQSPNNKVRIAAYVAVGKLTGPEDIDRVLSLVGSIEGDTGRKEVERAVVSVVNKIPDKPTRADTIIAVFKREKNTDARCSFLRILAALADDKSFEVVKSSVEDENEQVKDAAVRAITSWPDSEAMETLLTLFQSTDNQTHRVLALRGYIRLIGQDKDTAAAKKAEILGEIIEQVDTVAEKKNVMGSLASVKHPLALSIVSKYLSDPQVKEEAMLAAMQIAQAIAGARPGEVKAAAWKIEESASNEALREKARALLNIIEGFKDFITDWQVSGPYLKEGQNYSRLFDIPFAPETSDADVDWSLMPAGTNPAQPWLLDLAALYPGDNRVAYACTWIHSATQQKARLELGSDDGIKVWLNGEVVHANNTARAAIAGTDKVDVQLQEGWNKLMLKITQNHSPWEFCLKLRDSSGNKLESIAIDSFHQEPLTSLFDGKTFAGWEGELDWFRIQDGAIVGGKLSENIPHNFFLATEKEYYNFELRLKVKTSSPGVNGGIQFRSKRIPDHHEVKGYQADVSAGIWGGLYDESRRGRFLVPLNEDAQKIIKNNDWNDYRIRCVNDRIQLFVNGIKTVDYVETDPEIAKQSGIFAVQVHGGGPAEVWYKDITIKEL
jgi:HEAT repeat protein